MGALQRGRRPRGAGLDGGAQADADPSNAADDASRTARILGTDKLPINFNMGVLVGSYATVARMLDEMATVPGARASC